MSKIMYTDACGFAHNPNLPLVVFTHVHDVVTSESILPEEYGDPLAYDFYIERIYDVPHYGESSGLELLKCICRCAFADEILTEAESISIINICHSPEWQKIFKEMNFNEGWN